MLTEVAAGGGWCHHEPLRLTRRVDSTHTTLVRFKALVSTWAIAFAALAAVGGVVYAQLPAHTGLGLWLSPVLGPGVALYDVWNGSLLFGSGFGRIGNFAVFVLGSAVAWASVLVALVLLVRAVASSVRAPRT